MKMNGLSLFANVGIAELLLKKTGFDVLLANEIDEKRANFYRYSHEHAEMITGDVTKEEIQKKIVKRAKELKVNFIMATPPCQGMSTAGLMNPSDPRNQLITYAIDIIKKIKPKLIFLENVPQQLRTEIDFHGKKILVPTFIKKQLEKEYIILHEGVINMEDYGIPQHRARNIFILAKKDSGISWVPPHKKEQVTMKKILKGLPSIDPILNDYETHKLFPDFDKKAKKAQLIHEWHRPPRHSVRHVVPLMHTPEGKSAFQNDDKYKPKLKNGRISKGFANTYKRQEWNRPAFTITKYNGVLGSQNNGHPGKKKQDGTWSEPRVLTVYEIMLCSTIPPNWKIPNWASENFIRNVIGEAIPPLMVQKIFKGVKHD